MPPIADLYYATMEMGWPTFVALVEALSGHLRALLRDVLCGHLDSDLCAVADDLLAQTV